MKKIRKLNLILALLIVLIAAFFALIILGRKFNRSDFSTIIAPPPAPGSEVADYMDAKKPSYQAQTPVGTQIAQALNSAWAWSLPSAMDRQLDQAEQRVTVQSLDLEAFLAGVSAPVRQAMEQKVAAAGRRSEVYEESGAYRTDLIEEALLQALAAQNAAPAAFVKSEEGTLALRYEEGVWHVSERAGFPAAASLDADALGAQLLADCAAALTPLPLQYAIPEGTVLVPPAPEENYHVSRDPAEIAALLDSAEARSLIGERSLVWRPDLDFLPDSDIRLYLDETLLVIQWQEVEQLPVGTFAEILTADGSQLRRKIAGDTPGGTDFMTTSGYAAACNAVLALGGDFYGHHARYCGISVYDGEIVRFSPRNADTCFITADGDMLFAYRNDYSDAEQERAAQFVADNDVVFSLAFGPVLIDNGEDVTPGWYPWGEINDEYARSAIGLIEPLHYLSVNLNCTPEHNYLATLQDATDALLPRGCVKAYALDGGQTATTVFHGELVNPVQFGREKPISDIIYFVSALPAE